MPLPDGTLSLADVLAILYPGAAWSMEARGDDEADYASLTWDPGNAGPAPDLATLQSRRAEAQAALDRQAAIDAAVSSVVSGQGGRLLLTALLELGAGVRAVADGLPAEAWAAGAPPDLAGVDHLLATVRGMLERWPV